MIHRASVALVLLVSLFGLQGRAQDATPVPRLAITVTGASPMVWFLQKGSSAARAGVRAGDEIVSVDGQVMATFEAAKRTIETTTAGEHELVVLRDGTTRSFTITWGSDGTLRAGFTVLQGVRVVSMERGAPAQDFGVHEGDHITGVHTRPTRSSTA